MKTLDDLKRTYALPLPELIFRAAETHRAHHDPADIQRCALLSIKTGGCPEDCGYCSQSARYATPVQPTPLLSVAEVRAKAAQAQRLGATRFCMGAAWRGPRDGPQFDSVLEMVRAVRALGMEACVTLGMLTDEQAQRLRDAGLTAYNHNLDTSRRYYPNIVSTRSYDDRLETLRAVQQAGIAVCCGGILGMNETEEDRLLLLAELAALDPPPESIPINCLMPVPGTPLENAAPVDSLQLVRLIATTRLAFPKARVRLSAGRDRMSRELQVLCFLAGANSIFFGDRLLTAPNPGADADAELFRAMGLPAPAGARP
jgi:biotin synthase